MSMTANSTSGSFPCYLNDANTSKEISTASSPTVQESLGDLLKNNNFVIYDNRCYPKKDIISTKIYIK